MTSLPLWPRREQGESKCGKKRYHILIPATEADLGWLFRVLDNNHLEPLFACTLWTSSECLLWTSRWNITKAFQRYSKRTYYPINCGSPFIIYEFLYKLIRPRDLTLVSMLYFKHSPFQVHILFNNQRIKQQQHRNCVHNLDAVFAR